jgi:hypothetical protein
MALVKCKKCKTEVSSVAKVCPTCGVKSPGTKWWHKLIVASVLVFLIVLVFSRGAANKDGSVQAPEVDAAPVADQSPITPAAPEPELQVLSLAEQCALEGKIFSETETIVADLSNRFPLDSKLDYQEIAKYRVNFFNKELSKISDQLKDIRTTHLADDVVIRYASDISVRTLFAANSLHQYSRSGNVDDLKSLRDQLAEITKSHKNALSECKKVTH